MSASREVPGSFVRMVSSVSAGTLLAIAAGLSGCGTAPSAFPVVGAPVTGNDVPTLQILEPTANITIGRGDNFLIRWTDSDTDSNAKISFDVVNTVTNVAIALVRNINENDTGLESGPDSFTAGSSLIPTGTYYLRGVIDDSVNRATEVYATTAGGVSPQRVIITIVEPGQQPPTVPPTVAVVEPAINLSVAQDDNIVVLVQPRLTAPNQASPYDPDSNITLYVLLDLDLEPNNDDPANPLPDKIIVLRTQQLQAGAFGAVPFVIPITLDEVPPRADGEAYYIRATVDDLTNPRVHAYAPGTINVVGLAAGLVDLNDVGRTKSGAKLYGFNPGANVGSRMSSVSDFDIDGVDDCVVVAQYGNPRGFGPVGEAYLLYGRAGARYGGSIGVNSVADRLSGAIFEAPPVRRNPDGFSLPGSAFSNGITDVSFIEDLTGDGRPEIMVGMSRVFGAADPMDFDPGDSDLNADETTQEIEIVLRQGQVTVQTGDADPEITSFTYDGVIDTYISDATPNTSYGSSESISWRNDGTAEEWGLIKFENVLDEIPDSAITIDASTIDADIEIRIFRTGVEAELHQCYTDFTEQTTYATFSGGGGPVAEVDYRDDGGNGLDAVASTDAETIQLDVTELVRRLIDRDLTAYGEDLRFIIVPAVDAEAAGQSSARSSEFQFDRPTLKIRYNRLNLGGSANCYPDNWVNNFTDEFDEPYSDLQFYSGGMAVLINSSNRDNDGPSDPNRLESTSVALELVGQEAGFVFDAGGTDIVGGAIRARADNVRAEVKGTDPDEPGRVAGTRFVAGFYDFLDSRRLREGPREDLWGDRVAAIGDLNNDGFDELVFSAPRNERYLTDTFDANGFQSTHWQSTAFNGSIAVIPGANYNLPFWRDKGDAANATSTIPTLDQHRLPPFGRCTNPRERRHWLVPTDTFDVFAEDIDDMLGDGQSAGDFNLDGLDDLLCGAYLNDRSASLTDTGATYIIYGRSVIGDVVLENAESTLLRPPMLRVRGVRDGDQVGWRQASGLDVNGDRLDDIFFSAPRADFGGVDRATCGDVDSNNRPVSAFNACLSQFSAPGPDVQLFSDASCKAFDYDNDGDVDEDDRCVYCCVSGACEPADSCQYGTVPGDCCANLVDNGFVGVIFGGVFTDGDRDITQLASPDLVGAVFYGSASGHRAGVDVSSAGDFNEDGFGDLLIAVPGETRVDAAGRDRLGVVYLVFGGTHLYNTKWDLSQVGSVDLPGIVFLSPYVKGAPNEAPPTTVAFLGDLNRDGFGDIGIGVPVADFIDLSFPQGPDAPASDAAVGRRSNAGNAYIIYGNNFGTNRGTP